jgi:hypothetical protein
MHARWQTWQGPSLHQFSFQVLVEVGVAATRCGRGRETGVHGGGEEL